MERSTIDGTAFKKKKKTIDGTKLQMQEYLLVVASSTFTGIFLQQLYWL
jgi:hypothetical protein